MSIDENVQVDNSDDKEKLTDEFNTEIKPSEQTKKAVTTRQYEQTEEIFLPEDKKSKEFLLEVPGPSDYTDNIPGLLEGRNIPKTSKVGEWGQNIAAASQMTATDNLYVESLNNPEAKFEQGILASVGSNSKLNIETTKLKRAPNQVIEGEKAVMMVRNMIGLGGYVRVPLFHSGFWVNIKAPGEAELLELNRQLTSDKIELGRASYGLAYSNQNVFYVSRLFEFAKSCIHSHSIKTERDVSEFIYSHDVPVLIWGLACAIWPNGFKLSRACLSNPEECHEIVSEILNLSKLLWTNSVGLNAWQKNHMLNKTTAVMSEDDVVRYRKELLNNQPRDIKFMHDDDEFTLKLKVPTVNEWVDQGTKWINSIAESVTTAISTTDSTNERNNMMIDMAKASALRQYSHWVETITFDTSVIEHRETVENTLSAISANDTIRDTVIKQIQRYIDDTVISMVGLPAYDCPACGKPQDSHDPLPKFKNIIPLEVNNIFFILVMQLVNRIRLR